MIKTGSVRLRLGPFLFCLVLAGCSGGGSPVGAIGDDRQVATPQNEVGSEPPAEVMEERPSPPVRILMMPSGAPGEGLQGRRSNERLRRPRAGSAAALLNTGRPEDIAMARRLYGQAALQGFPPAMAQYGMMLLKGRGGDADAFCAAVFLKLAVKGGIERAADPYSQALITLLPPDIDRIGQIVSRGDPWPDCVVN